MNTFVERELDRILFYCRLCSSNLEYLDTSAAILVLERYPKLDPAHRKKVRNDEQKQ